MTTAALSEASRSTYGSMWKQFVKFCSFSWVKANPFEADEGIFWFYCCYQYPKLSYASMKSYLAAIRAVYLDNGYEDPFRGMSRLERLLIGYKKSKRSNKKKKKRQPVTVKLLQKMKRSFNFRNRQDVVLWAILVVGVYGLLRLGEVTGQSLRERNASLAVKREPMKRKHLEWVSDSHFRIFIPASKTDLFSEGVTVDYYENGSATCPIAAMSAVHPRGTEGDNSPLFTKDRSSKPWTRTNIVEGLKTKLKSIGEHGKDYSGHSLRRGGAQTLFDAGVPHWLIQAMGRWKSWCFKRYVDVKRNSSRFRDISRRMAGL